jgi:hypothetical protein
MSLRELRQQRRWAFQQTVESDKAIAKQKSKAGGRRPSFKIRQSIGEAAVEFLVTHNAIVCWSDSAQVLSFAAIVGSNDTTLRLQCLDSMQIVSKQSTAVKVVSTHATELEKLQLYARALVAYQLTLIQNRPSRSVGYVVYQTQILSAFAHSSHLHQLFTAITPWIQRKSQESDIANNLAASDRPPFRLIRHPLHPDRIQNMGNRLLRQALITSDQYHDIMRCYAVIATDQS